MFLIDDALLSPFRAVVWIAETIRDAADEQTAASAAEATEELRCLYLDLERGQITEEQFDAGERVLLDRLDRLREADAGDDEDEALESADGEDGDSEGVA